MLINSVIIILREVLEASVLVALLLALSQRASLHLYWLVFAAVGGAFGAWLYGYYLGELSAWLDGTGQEVINAALQFAIYCLLLYLLGALTRARYQSLASASVRFAMAAATVMAVTREGSEIYLFLSGFRTVPELAGPVLAGAFIGSGIGYSIGALFYIFLTRISPSHARRLIFLLLMLVGAGMCAQATQLLIQSDWISASGPVWDSSSLIPEGRVVGELLYAVLGYEATPTLAEVVAYGLSLALMVTVYSVQRQTKRTSAEKGVMNEHHMH